MLFVGCTAVDVGAPDVRRSERTVIETASTPQTEVTAVRMVHSAVQDNSISVGLVADIRNEFARTSHKETDIESRQKRLAFGFFPAAAELYCVPGNAVRSPCFKHSYPVTFALCLPFMPLGTASSLFLELPVGSYDCSKGKARDAYSHVGVLGFHKYTATSKWTEGGPKRLVGPLISTQSAVPVPGPYEVELDIPALGQRPLSSIAGSDGCAIFKLPSVTQDQTVRARVMFRHAPGLYGQVADDVSHQALNMAAGRRYEFGIALRGDGRQQGTVRPCEPAAQPFSILEVRPGGGGRYVVRVEVLDYSQTLEIALRIVQPHVRRLVRENFQSNNPGEPLHYIRECLEYETEKGGRVLVFTGWAFSVRPAENGWRYDPHTRKGWVRIRIVGGMPAEDAKRWARKDIDAIVADKNIVTVLGAAPPPGAKYRSLGETFEDGILKIDFEAVE